MIKRGSKHQAVLPAMGEPERTHPYDSYPRFREPFTPHSKRFRDRDLLSPRYEDRRYNLSGGGWLTSFVRIERGMAVRIRNHGWGVIVGFRDTRNMDATWSPFLVELMDDTTIYVSETDIEFARISDDGGLGLGHISVVKDGCLQYIEFQPWHKEFGEIHYYKRGHHVRTEFTKSHPMHGEIHYFERSKERRWPSCAIDHVRTEFAESHPMHGETRFYVNNVLERITMKDGRTFVSDDKMRTVEILVVD